MPMHSTAGLPSLRRRPRWLFVGPCATTRSGWPAASSHLSHKAPHDEGGGKLYEREVVLGLLLPPDEQLAVTIEPGVRASDAPASRALPTPTASALLTATTNVRHEAAAPHRLVRVGVVVA